MSAILSLALDTPPGFRQTSFVHKSIGPKLRQIPSITRIMTALGEVDLPGPMVLKIVRKEVDSLRLRLKTAGDADDASMEELVLRNIRKSMGDLGRGRIQTVINATGVIIHTNLGRSPMGRKVVDRIATAASDYSNLEFDLGQGQRGSRGRYLEHSLAVLCSSEAATVVNNCAAALLLILRHFTAASHKKEVVISRGELVQIGGGFRIPEILQASGAVLREVGTTNITTVGDYRSALGPNTALILKVHQSNFAMKGFVDQPSTEQLAEIARESDLSLVVDLGSGALFETEELGGREHEPIPAETLRRGADLVCFSGDKLIGGPQAGIIAGKASLIAEVKRDPFFRALRCDKLVLAGLEATVDLLLRNDVDEIPVRAMMEADGDQLRNRADAVIEKLRAYGIHAEAAPAESQVGGGCLPGTILPSIAIELRSGLKSAKDIAESLRQSTPPVIAVIADDKIKLDLRTVFPAQDVELTGAIIAAMNRAK